MPQFIYQRHQPENTVPHQLFANHLDDLLTQIREQTECGLPFFVERELRAYLECGILDYGFIRVHCDTCNDDLLVAFRCKSRTICPSCATRRMYDGTAHLVDRVLPKLRYRQWVMSFPKWLRVHLALDAKLNSRVLQIVMRTIFSWQRHKACSLDLRKTRNAAVTFLQRFGSAIQLNPHFHILVPDGVFGPRFANSPGEPPTFFELRPPSDEEVEAILLRIVRKVIRLCERLELKERTFTEEQLALASAVTLRMPGGSPLEDPPVARRPSAFYRGFSLHANVSVHKNDREGLERLSRYGLRPPFALERMSLTPTGDVAYQMKRALPDGTKTLVLSPLDFLGRVASQVAPPRSHLVHYHGLFAPHARDRELIVPRAQELPAPATMTEGKPEAPDTEPSAKEPRPRRLDWASLLRRVFAVDVLRCNHCGGRRRIIAAITSPTAIEGILTHLGLAARAPPCRLTRRPRSEQFELPGLNRDPCADPLRLAE